MGLKLSDLLSKSIELSNMDSTSVYNNLNNYISEVESILQDLVHVDTSESKKLAQEIKILLDKYYTNTYNISKNLRNIVYNDINQYIIESENIWKENSEKMLFHEHLEWSTLWPPNQTEFELFSAKISNHTNWQYPGLIYGAKNSNILESIKSAEPLYILEQYKEYFSLQKEKFHLDFVRKLKFYQLNDINLLPKNDIGVIAVFNEFTFLPWDMIKIILQKLSDCLMPGGILIFNYNNCTTVRGFKEFEDRKMTFTTPKMYVNFLYKQKIHVIENYVSDKETFSFMIFKKDGNRNLIKKYPSVGFVKQQPSFTHRDLNHTNRLELIRKLCSK